MNIRHRNADSIARKARRGSPLPLILRNSTRARTACLITFTMTIAVLLLVQTGSPLLAREVKTKVKAVESTMQAGPSNQESVTVAIHQSRVIKLRTPVARVSVANPEIADLLVLDPQQIYVVGKKIGNTNMMLWSDKDQLRGTMLLEVTPDLEQLKVRLHQVLPNERIQVRSAQDTIVLNGEVSSPGKAEAAVRIAESYVTGGGTSVAGGQPAGGLMAGAMGGAGGLGGAGAGGSGTGAQSKVLNMLQVGGSQQVMLEVKIAEMSREVLKRLDANFSGFYNGGGFKMGTLASNGTYNFPNTAYSTTQNTIQRVIGSNGTSNLQGDYNVDTNNLPPSWLTSQNGGNVANTINTTASTTYNATTGTIDSSGSSINPRLGIGVPTYIVPNSFTTSATGKALFAQFLGGNFLLNSYIDAEKNRGLVKILAEPNLTTLSGQEAKFLSGGEYPYTVAQPSTTGVTAYTTNFKEYGIGVLFVPVVLDSGVISLKLNLNVSELDYKNVNPLSGVPGLRVRTANSTVEIKSGETISIAGLISEDLRENINRFPGIGEIPVLGALFSSMEFRKKQSELVMLVTPRLARSFDPQQAKLPTEGFVEPNDLEFYLLGRLQGRKSQPVQASPTAPTGPLGPDKTGSEGTFGHDL